MPDSTQIHINTKGNEQHTYDAIVIGSGISGGWAAKELCEKGLRTLVLERGRKIEHLKDYPTMNMGTWEFPHRMRMSEAFVKENPLITKAAGFGEDTAHFFIKDADHPYIQEKPFDWIRGYQVGGKSLTWGRSCQRWSDWDFSAPHRYGYATDWPIRYRDIAPWYSHTEKFIGVCGNKDGVESMPDGEFLPAYDLNVVEKHMKDVLWKKYKRYYIQGRWAHLTEPQAIHAEQGRGQCVNRNACMRGCPFGGYFSSVSSTLPWAKKTGNLTIRPHSVVHSIIYDDKQGKATGVRVIDANTHQAIEYFAKIIFVNASALNTNLVLLNSVSSRFPAGLGNDNGLLGKYICFHNYRGSMGGLFEGYENKYYKGFRPAECVIPNYRNLHKRETDFIGGYVIFTGAYRETKWWSDEDGIGASLKESLSEPGSWRMYMYMQGETIPKETNHVRLSEDKKDQWGIPLLITSVDYDDNDEKLLKDFLEQGQQMLEAAGARDIQTWDTKQPPGLDIHEMGGVRMGRDPKTSLLNEWNQVHACKNVFVTDGACMTSTGNQSPSILYMAFTARAANHAVEELKNKTYKQNMKKTFVFLLAVVVCVNVYSQQKTYCNPVNVDYGYTPIPNFSEWGRHRATADPVIVNYKGDFYLFSTNQWGYWWSPDMLNWKFISRKFLRPWNTGTYDELCAPAVGIIGDTMLVFGSTYTRKFTIWMSTNPKANEWKPLVDSFDIGGWDPAFFTDDDGRFYMYNGSSNNYPIYGVELNRKTMQPIGTRAEMYFLQSWRYGWQRFGEYMDDTFLDAFIEGAWMTKHNGKYYLQYGAPGTEFSGYADGVVVGDNPLGPFEPQSDPFSFKPGGFARGAGHGSTFQDNNKNYWHVSTISISVKNNFERRIGIWPAGFDKDGVMWCNTVFGDYPHFLTSGFTGWMLLNYKKPITVSSTLGAYNANNAVDENIKTYWSAATANKGEWIQTDLGNVSTVNAVQINYADQDVSFPKEMDTVFLGKSLGLYHQYKLYYSVDGKKWTVLADKSNNKTDVPHDYIELSAPVQARYIKLENIHMPTGKFAISGLRVFGNGNGAKPGTVKTFMVLRTQKDKRSAWIRWSPVDNAYAYNIYYGTSPDKLYSCIMVHDANEYWFKAMDKEKTYYFSIESINENGVSERTKVIEVN